MKYILLFVFIIIIMKSAAQSDKPLRELRGVWISTVKMLDFPSARGLDGEELKAEIRTVLDTCRSIGANAIFFQVRPAADAFYFSKIEPWSEWLTGKQGRAPNPYFDPLLFMADEAHKRKMRIYAWINPFRAVATVEYADITPEHITKQKPQWFFTYGKHKYFNPGIPEVRNYITNVIRDIVARYPIDGIIFDDYFYPYPERDENNKIIDIPDYATFKKYGQGFSNIKDWRRNNMNLFIEQVSKAIKEEKPWVIFGISPPAVWRNKRYDPKNGSDTRGLAAYDWLYADILYWLKNGWIDFVSPQLYFYRGHKYADYITLLKWWSENTYGRNLYISLNLNALENPKKNWKNPSEIPEEIRMARKSGVVKGFILYRYKDILNNPLGITDSIRSEFFNNFVYYPLLPYVDSIPPKPPAYVDKYRMGNEITVFWEEQFKENLSPADTVDFYVVYRFEGKQPGELSEENVFLRTYEPEFTIERKHKFQLFGKTYTFVITAWDKFHNESKPAEPIRIKFSKNE